MSQDGDEKLYTYDEAIEIARLAHKDARSKARAELEPVITRMRNALLNIKALKDGYKGEDMGRVAGYRVCGQIAEAALEGTKESAADYQAGFTSAHTGSES